MHGTGLFTRGQTQVLSITTLGGVGDAQRLDTLSPHESKRYMHHYNFPPYSVGETGRMGGAGRREIGHGALAERAVLPVLPDVEDFPYTIRIVSEVLSSNGSTSMGSACGSTLSLMDAGVPIKAPVAGVAMGLIMGEDGNYKVLTDIAGLEDAMGDMDFKVAGTEEGITALQMDIKIQGIPMEVLRDAVSQAREGRMHIMSKMLEAIAEPRERDVAVRAAHAPPADRPAEDRHRHRPRRPRHPFDHRRDRLHDRHRGRRLRVHRRAPTRNRRRRAISIIEGMTKDVEVGRSTPAALPAS